MTRGLAFGGLLLLCCAPGPLPCDACARQDDAAGALAPADGGLTEPVDAGLRTRPSSLQPCTRGQTTCPASERCAVQELSLAAACFFGDCDVVAQDCASGFKCAHVREGRAAVRRCVPDGSRDDGAACTAADECAKGSRCVEGTCARYCDSTTHCGAFQICARLVVLAPEGELALTCRPLTRCDPFQPVCRTGQCSLTSQGPVCLPAGTLPLHAPCRLSEANCGPGLHCLLDATGRGACAPLCNLDGGAPSCTSGACRALQTSGFGTCQ